MYASTGMGAVRTGLNYPSVLAVGGVMELDDLQSVFEGVRIIERSLLDVDNEIAEAKRDGRRAAEGKTYRHR